MAPGAPVAVILIAASNAPQSVKDIADYVCDGVHDEVEINTAIAALQADSGGLVQLSHGTFHIGAPIEFHGGETVTLAGEGIAHQTGHHNTILYLDDNSNCDVITMDTNDEGSGKDSALYHIIRDLAIMGNKAHNTSGCGINSSGTSDCTFMNLAITDTPEDGLRMCGTNCRALNVWAEYCGKIGIHCYYAERHVVRHCFCSTCETGIQVTGGTFGTTIIGNGIWDSLKIGIRIYGSAENHNCGGIIACNMVGESSQREGYNNYYAQILLENCDYWTVVGNICVRDDATNDPKCGIELLSSVKYAHVYGNRSYGHGTAAILIDGTCPNVYDNEGAMPTEEHKLITVKNQSGGDLVQGDVVVLKTTAAGNEVTTTTTAGDPLVFGMVDETIANGASGHVLIRGKTTALKVDGTVDIAVGDLLSTSTTAGVAKKAASGETAFAVALEDYTADDANGIIDALLIAPRYVS